MLKIICPVSTDGKVTKQTMKSLSKLPSGYIWEIVPGCDIGQQICSEISLDIPEHLFLDSDIEFTENDIDILRHSGCDVVSGAYKKSVLNGRIVGNLQWINEGEKAFVAGKWGKMPGMVGSMVSTDCTALMPVDWCGSGFLYTKTTALKKILELCNDPIFYHQTIKYPSLKFGVSQTSYDFGFSLNCMKAGIKIWLNCGCQVRHVKRK